MLLRHRGALSPGCRKAGGEHREGPAPETLTQQHGCGQPGTAPRLFRSTTSGGEQPGPSQRAVPTLRRPQRCLQTKSCTILSKWTRRMRFKALSRLKSQFAQQPTANTTRPPPARLGQGSSSVTAQNTFVPPS